MRVALLEDEAEQAERISRLLEEAGHRVHAFSRGRALLNTLRTESFDLIILDWEVPGQSGFEVLESLRAGMAAKVPVLFLTHRDSEADIVQALQAGADDFLIKPARDRELLARLEALERRSLASGRGADIIELPPFRVDCAKQQIEREGRPLELTRREFEVAVLLIRNLGQVMSRGHIMEAVWGQRDATTTRTVDMHVSRVRQVLGLSAAIGLRLAAIYGFGYRLERVREEA
ncbi:MAG: response regulator transcription factor [Steroidobacteraceae bacterium]